jgi:hypothetical protein
MKHNTPGHDFPNTNSIDSRAEICGNRIGILRNVVENSIEITRTLGMMKGSNVHSDIIRAPILISSLLLRKRKAGKTEKQPMSHPMYTNGSGLK